MEDFLAWVRCQWDRMIAVAAVFVGLAAIVLGWFGVSGASLTTEQIPYLASGAVGGLFALGVAATIWLSADMRDEWQKLDDIQRTIEAIGPEHLANGAPTNGTDAAEPPARLGRARRRDLTGT